MSNLPLLTKPSSPPSNNLTPWLLLVPKLVLARLRKDSLALAVPARVDNKDILLPFLEDTCDNKLEVMLYAGSLADSRHRVIVSVDKSPSGSTRNLGARLG